MDSVGLHSTEEERGGQSHTPSSMAEPGFGSGPVWLQRSCSRGNQSGGLQVAWLAGRPMSSCIPFAALPGCTRMPDRGLAACRHSSAPEESETSPLLSPAWSSKPLQTLLKSPLGSQFLASTPTAQGPRAPGLVQSGASKRQCGDWQEVERPQVCRGSVSNGCDFGQAGQTL